MQVEDEYVKAAKVIHETGHFQLVEFHEARVALVDISEEQRLERQRRAVIFSQQQAEAERAMELLLKEEDEARKAMAVRNARKPRKKGK